MTSTSTGPKRSARHRVLAAMALAILVGACGGSAASPSASAPGASATPAGTTDLILATTTSTQDSGLLDELIPAFEAATGFSVKTVAVGSGQAIQMGQEGNADVLFVHSPKAEMEFVDAGWGVDRALAMHNYFLLVGPPADPAGIKGLTSAKEALGKIAAAEATFVSRGDKSGTETKELGLWAAADITPEGGWYLQSGQGMGATLQIASEKGGYTLTDDATFLANSSKYQLESLVAGDPSLLNIYHVIVVNPEKWPKVNNAGAVAFAGFVTGADGQALIAAFGTETYGQPLFTADAGKDETTLK
jgi:tungstate transport system substrate-binding protein